MRLIGYDVRLLDWPGEVSLLVSLAGRGRCVLKCDYCFLNKKRMRVKDVDIENVISQYDDWITAVIISGREPLLYLKDTKEVIEIAKRYGKRIRIDTSLVPNRIRKVINDVDTVCVDLKGTEEIYSQYGGNVEDVRDGIRTIIENEKPYSVRIVVRNGIDLDEMYRFWKYEIDNADEVIVQRCIGWNGKIEGVRKGWRLIE